MFASLASSQEKSKTGAVVTKWYCFNTFCGFWHKYLRQESLDNLFKSWRAGSRRLFYVLCTSFTALFAHVEGDENSAPSSCGSLSSYRTAVTPSNIGFKEILRSEGKCRGCCCFF